MSSDLLEIQGDTLKVNAHPGQIEAWECDKRFILVLAGTQGGKTSFGPLWLWKEIQEKGPGDYAVISPSFALMETKALPEFKRLFVDMLSLGRYKTSPVRKFEFSRAGLIKTFGSADQPCTVYFGYAANPDSLESATYKGIWADEAGQKEFKEASWEALLRRLSIHQGRALLTTTPYDLGWIKTRLHDKAVDTKGNPIPGSDVGLIRFESTMNPAFPLEEFERARHDMQKWRFDLFYRAIFTRPAGAIYDCFDEDVHVVPRFQVPEHWLRYAGSTLVR